jgi:hypothetical protein
MPLGVIGAGYVVLRAARCRALWAYTSYSTLEWKRLEMRVMLWLAVTAFAVAFEGRGDATKPTDVMGECYGCIHHSHYGKPEECASVCEYAGNDSAITRLVGQPCVPLPIYRRFQFRARIKCALHSHHNEVAGTFLAGALGTLIRVGVLCTNTRCGSSLNRFTRIAISTAPS